MLLIYDGDCGFCTTSARWFALRAGDSARIAPWQTLDLDEYGLTEAEASSAVRWFDGTTTTDGADACAAAMKSCTNAWRFVGHALAAPGMIQLGRLVYPVIAKNRHRLPGATNACRLD